MSSFPRATLAGFLLFLTSCGSFLQRSENVPQLSLPAVWQSQNESFELAYAPICLSPESPWWDEYLSSDEVKILKSILLANPDIRIAAQRVREAEARARIQGADQYPELGFGGSGARNRRAFVGLPIPGSSQRQVLNSISNSFGISLNLSWEIDLWGQLNSRARAARYDFESSEQLYRSAVLSLIGQVVKLMWRIREAGEQIRISESVVQYRRELFTYFSLRFKKGLSKAAELEDARARLARSEAALLLFHANASQFIQQLEVLAGEYPDAHTRISPRWSTDLSEVPVGVPASVLERRPDIIAARAELLAADERLDEAELNLLPNISLSAGGGTTTNEFEEVLNNDFQVWNLAASLTQPIFQGGRILAGIDSAEAASKRERAEYVKQVLQALYEVESSLDRERFLSAREQALFEETQALERRAEQFLSRYRLGTATKSERMSAVFDWLERRREYTTARANRIANRVDLHLAIGGGFESVGVNFPEIIRPGESKWVMPMQIETKADVSSIENLPEEGMESLFVLTDELPIQCGV